ncbi:MAG: amidinotransferase [bacterium]
MHDNHRAPAAFGGAGWQPRPTPLREELGTIWSQCGVSSESAPIRSVLLHRPGAELGGAQDPDASLLLQPLDLARAQAQHDHLADAFRRAGITVHSVEPAVVPPVNQMFCADLLLMTPEGAVLGRPAARVRAGEERHVAARLAALGIPILRSVRGAGTFEGADAAWLREDLVMVARGLRTNADGAAQVAATLAELGVRTIEVTLPSGTMHLMGQLRFLDEGRGIGWPGRLPADAQRALAAHNYELHFMPDEQELRAGMAMNLVTLAPGRVLMPANNPRSQEFLECLGVRCETTPVDELTKAAGAIGCLTGILERG